MTVTPLTMKGYLGDSVKARVQALAEQEEGGGAQLSARRGELLKALGQLDRYCYERQTAFGGGSAPSSDGVLLLEGAVRGIDSIVEALQ